MLTHIIHINVNPQDSSYICHSPTAYRSFHNAHTITTLKCLFFPIHSLHIFLFVILAYCSLTLIPFPLNLLTVLPLKHHSIFICMSLSSSDLALQLCMCMSYLPNWTEMSVRSGPIFDLYISPQVSLSPKSVLLLQNLCYFTIVNTSVARYQ